ncbi:MAG: PfkB family carbohydrate kinase [Spirochaetia bacterium]|jgi:sugar/nucleoside kinase (ribokinase family)
MVFVVGAVAIDLVAVRERFLEGTSNPSDIRLGLGGVGYRIFSNLDAPRKFITALAGDPISRWAREALEAEGGVAIQRVRDKDAGPPLYLALMESGSLKVAASDFRIVEQSLSVSFAVEQIGEPGHRDFLILDANLSFSVLAELVRRYSAQTRVVFEPVSVEKAARHARTLKDLFLLTPTEEEMAALTDADVQDYRRARRIGCLLVTLGRQGLRLYDDTGEEAFAPARVVDTPDTTGAGDLLLASLVSRLHAGEPMRTAVRSAMHGVEQRLQAGDLL